MADSVLWLTRVLATGLALILSCGWFEFQQSDKSSHCYSKADSSSRGWIWIDTNSFFQLDTSCGWFYPATNWGLYNWNNPWLTQALVAFSFSFFFFHLFTVKNFLPYVQINALLIYIDEIKSIIQKQFDKIDRKYLSLTLVCTPFCALLCVHFVKKLINKILRWFYFQIKIIINKYSFNLKVKSCKLHNKE